MKTKKKIFWLAPAIKIQCEPEASSAHYEFLSLIAFADSDKHKTGSHPWSDNFIYLLQLHIPKQPWHASSWF
jgi:hypothetical protein